MTKPASLSAQDSHFSWLPKISVQPEATNFSSFNVLYELYVAFYAEVSQPGALNSVSSGLSYIRDNNKPNFNLGTTLKQNFDMFLMKEKSGMQTAASSTN